MNFLLTEDFDQADIKKKSLKTHWNEPARSTVPGTRRQEQNKAVQSGPMVCRSSRGIPKPLWES